MSNVPEPPPQRKKVLGVQPNVFFLGLTSLLNDISSEMTFTLLPLFLANVLGVGTAIIGLVEGVADSTATLLRVASGWLSDRLGKRKGLAVLGYSLSTVVKPLLYFANAWTMVLAVRFTDRVGKGIRTAPRDALVADSSDANERGKSFGLHRAMDTAGAMTGLALAAAIVYLLQRGELTLERHTFQVLILAGIVPAVLGILFLILFVREKRKTRSTADNPQSALKKKSTGFDLRFKIFLGILILFTLGNSSDAFLILRAQNLGLSVLHIILLLVLFNLVYSLTSTPAGILSDRWGRKALIGMGWALYGLVYLGFAMASATWQVVLLFAAYGVFYGMTEGVTRALVADIVPEEKRGTAYGLFNGAVGITVLPASLIAGFLWQGISPAAPFYFGAIMALVALLSLMFLLRR